jgi:ABC-type transport system involved in multi-copper enzyme maturation permease subunit
MKRTNIFSKILMLNIAADGAWIFFAMAMVFYWGIPWYIGMMPIALSVGIYLIGVQMVNDYNKRIPRTGSAVIPDTNNRDDVDELLSTIADQNLGNSPYTNTHTVGSNIVYNNND